MQFADCIADWQQKHGRHHLPWQNTNDPYKVWLSEIMLQQTQVLTVIPYYERFLAAFPTLQSLAAAPQDSVLTLWAGLGYYARARNLHKCAQTVMQEWQGKFPENPQDIMSLPGIGKSTANAIAAFCFAEKSPIMDGNVKRIFTRFYGIEGQTNKKEIENRLWEQAYKNIEQASDMLDMKAYTQGQMDLGATICTRSKPACTSCPLSNNCFARRENRQAELPTPKTKKTIPVRSVNMLLIQYQNRIFLEQRPQQGIWGGLWSLPEFHTRQELQGLQNRWLQYRPPLKLAAFEHVFTHFRLHIQPWWLQCEQIPLQETAEENSQWLALDRLDTIALPAPILKLLQGMHQVSGAPDLLGT
ncbi:MAG: A/G-specific adenine glycosylase [Alcaligenaceae bacterium]|nr:A/G-specific adenine glycosylase [Alcaligenaceae bacterium]